MCVYILLKDVGCYLGVIGKLHNDECLIYIFTGEVLNDTPNIFNRLHYHCWYKILRNKCLPVMIDTTNKMFILESNEWELLNPPSPGNGRWTERVSHTLRTYKGRM